MYGFFNNSSLHNSSFQKSSRLFRSLPPDWPARRGDSGVRLRGVAVEGVVEDGGGGGGAGGRLPDSLSWQSSSQPSEIPSAIHRVTFATGPSPRVWGNQELQYLTSQPARALISFANILPDEDAF